LPNRVAVLPAKHPWERRKGMFIQAAVIQIAQPTVVVLVVTSAVFVVGLMVLLGLFIWRAENPLEYGSFFVVSLGITTALMGFLAAFPLIISGVFEDPTQVLAILSALFGTLVGLVGTYFGVKTSSDAREGAQDLVRQSQAQQPPPPGPEQPAPEQPEPQQPEPQQPGPQQPEHR